MNRRKFSTEKAARPQPASAGGLLEAKVGHVFDGDTITVFDGKSILTIRLDAIDSPEDGQPWALRACSGLSKMISGRHVYLELHGTDIYDRTLATVYVMDGSELINVNEQMVTQGHAWYMKQYANHLSTKRRRMLWKLEEWAREKRKGLWKAENPIPPWEWRKKNQS